VAEPTIDGAFELLDLMILDDADHCKSYKRDDGDEKISSDARPAAVFVGSPEIKEEGGKNASDDQDSEADSEGVNRFDFQVEHGKHVVARTPELPLIIARRVQIQLQKSPHAKTAYGAPANGGQSSAE
jgi:hypothetical protein